MFKNEHYVSDNEHILKSYYDKLIDFQLNNNLVQYLLSLVVTVWT